MAICYRSIKHIVSAGCVFSLFFCCSPEHRYLHFIVVFPLVLSTTSYSWWFCYHSFFINISVKYHLNLSLYLLQLIALAAVIDSFLLSISKGIVCFRFDLQMCAHFVLILLFTTPSSYSDSCLDIYEYMK